LAQARDHPPQPENRCRNSAPGPDAARRPASRLPRPTA
jgi:hypothetical protein